MHPWMGARRFRLRQKGKVRLVDYESEFWQNDSVSETETVIFDGADGIAAAGLRGWSLLI